MDFEIFFGKKSLVPRDDEIDVESRRVGRTQVYLIGG
jgi:hypothetical protein